MMKGEGNINSQSKL